MANDTCLPPKSCYSAFLLKNIDLPRFYPKNRDPRVIESNTEIPAFPLTSLTALFPKTEVDQISEL